MEETDVLAALDDLTFWARSRQDREEMRAIYTAVTALIAERDALRADAERYRWLRDPQRLVEASDDEGTGDDAWFIGERSAERWGICGEVADKAIDNARGAE